MNPNAEELTGETSGSTDKSYAAALAGMTSMDQDRASASDDDGFQPVRKRIRTSRETFQFLAPKEVSVVFTATKGSLGSVNPNKVHSALTNCCGPYISAKSRADSSLVVKVGSLSAAKKLLAIKDIVGVKVSAAGLGYLAAPKATIHDVDRIWSNEAIVEALQMQGVEEAWRLTRKDEEGKIHIRETVVLRFRSLPFPKTVEIAERKYEVKPYVAAPIRCMHCQRYAHVAKVCRREARCCKCGENHGEKDCRAEGPKCCNCQLTHRADFPDCPVRLKLYMDRKKQDYELFGLKFGPQSPQPKKKKAKRSGSSRPKKPSAQEKTQPPESSSNEALPERSRSSARDEAEKSVEAVPAAKKVSAKKPRKSKKGGKQKTNQNGPSKQPVVEETELNRQHFLKDSTPAPKNTAKKSKITLQELKKKTPKKRTSASGESSAESLAKKAAAPVRLDPVSQAVEASASSASAESRPEEAAATAVHQSVPRAEDAVGTSAVEAPEEMEIQSSLQGLQIENTVESTVESTPLAPVPTQSRQGAGGPDKVVFQLLFMILTLVSSLPGLSSEAAAVVESLKAVVTGLASAGPGQ